MSDVLWRRLRYMLSPQWDHYNAIGPRVIDQHVLEIGCATGFGAMQLAGYAKSVYAIDIDGEAIAFCKQSWPGRSVEFAHADIVNLLETEKRWGAGWDAAVMLEVLEHVADRLVALKNIVSLLRPGGTLYVSARNALADLRRNDLHNDEKTATEFFAELSPLFSRVSLHDYSLKLALSATTHITPIIAVCVK